MGQSRTAYHAWHLTRWANGSDNSKDQLCTNVVSRPEAVQHWAMLVLPGHLHARTQADIECHGLEQPFQAWGSRGRAFESRRPDTKISSSGPVFSTREIGLSLVVGPSGRAPGVDLSDSRSQRTVPE